METQHTHRSLECVREKTDAIPLVDTVGIIGPGNASRILLPCLLELQANRQQSVYFWTRSKTKAVELEREFPGFQRADIGSIFENCNIIYLGVPSVALRSILQPFRKSLLFTGKLMFSLSPELPQKVLNEMMPRARVIRILHNLPCQVGKGIVIVYCDEKERDNVFQQALNHLGMYGNVIVVQEERLLMESIPLLCLPAILLKSMAELEKHISQSCPDLPGVPEMFRRTIVGVGAWLETLNEDYETGVNLIATPGGLTEKAVRHVAGNIHGLTDAFQLELEAVRQLERST